MVNNVAKTSHHIDYCSTAPVTLAIDRLIIPNTPSSSNPYYPNTLYVDMYEWTLPTGWRTSDNKTGTFTTPSYSISVIPAAGAGGQVKVRGWNQECSTFSSPRVNFYSNYSTLDIDREPRLEVAQGPAEVYCGDQTPITYTVANLPGATYAWALPPGWSGSSTTNTITVTPSGSGAGNISATATFNCTNPAKAVSSPAKQVTYNPSLKPVEFTAAPYFVCNGGTAFSVSATGASSYTWTTTGGMLINGQPSPLTTSSSSVVISLANQFASGSAQVTVVAGSGGCGNSAPATRSVWMNVPAQPQPNVYGNPATINLNLGGWTQVVANAAAGSTFEDVHWSVANRTAPGTPVTGLALNQSQGRVTSIEALEAGYYYLMLRSWNACGYSAYFYIDVNVTVGGGGGGATFTVQATPNPASDYIDVKIKKEKAGKQNGQFMRLALFDSQGNLVQEELAGEGSKRLDVRRHREGFYYLHLYHQQGVEKKQLIIRR